MKERRGLWCICEKNGGSCGNRTHIRSLRDDLMSHIWPPGGESFQAVTHRRLGYGMDRKEVFHAAQKTSELGQKRMVAPP